MAAGGGGDAVGILLARRVLDPEPVGPALISTCAWERLRIDPVPGPRSIQDFTGLGSVNGLAVEVLPSSDTQPPGRSVLPRLSADTDRRIFLHDFDGGAHGLATQLSNLASAADVDRLVVVDVGGDVVGTGEERNLLSPLADSLTLAAALASGLPTSLAVVGPGTDAELTEQEVTDRLSSLGGHVAGLVAPPDVERCAAILDWHPTEASALVAASALGARGAVEMRRGRQPTALTAHGCEVWIAEHPRLQDFPLAAAVAPSLDLDEAIAAIEQLAVNEIAYERRKAAQLDSTPRQEPRPIHQVVAQALRSGATHITTRRLLEQTGLSATPDAAVLDTLDSPSGRIGGLWELRDR